jgi:ATP-binding cassette subfamily B protein
MPDPFATDRPKARTLKPLRALLPFLRPYRAMLLSALVALLVAAAAMLALPIAFRYLIDEGLSSRSTETINRYFIAFMAAAAVYGIFAALRFYLVTWLGERVVADIRSRGVCTRHPHGSRLLRDHARRRSAVAPDRRHDAGAVDRRRQPLDHAAFGHSLLGSLVMLAVTSPKLTGMIVVLMPVVLVPLIVLGRRVRSLSRSRRTASPTPAASPKRR